jgi:hypothetical protein
VGPDGIKWELPTFELEKWNSVYHTVHSNVSYELSTSKKGIKEQVLIEKKSKDPLGASTNYHIIIILREA